MSPIKVLVTDQWGTFAHFLVRFCAVVGGCFALTGMLDRWIHRIVSLAKEG